MKKKKNKMRQGVFFRNILPSKKLSIQVEQRPRTLIIHCVSRASIDYTWSALYSVKEEVDSVDRRENNMGSSMQEQGKMCGCMCVRERERHYFPYID